MAPEVRDVLKYLVALFCTLIISVAGCNVAPKVLQPESVVMAQVKYKAELALSKERNKHARLIAVNEQVHQRAMSDRVTNRMNYFIGGWDRLDKEDRILFAKHITVIMDKLLPEEHLEEIKKRGKGREAPKSEGIRVDTAPSRFPIRPRGSQDSRGSGEHPDREKTRQEGHNNRPGKAGRELRSHSKEGWAIDSFDPGWI